ncbi:hypothetical protein PVAR5_8101 [Paecilomyces variotii No. 5]|uniref:Uncharacterized protein n=1 Tax=Byssochlamys spectabilis (strain No. 5 / NBRC 109023) TaxID=1356009 RepID=V5GBJ0_BYSSN|nr:hypothetical protein PVAR5_8101 [Paecilomyces variotii No. 5]
MKFTSVVAALGALNVAMAAPAGLPGLGDIAGLIPGLPAGLPTPPSGSLPVPTGAVPSSIPTPGGLPFELPGLSQDSGIVRRSFVQGPAKGAFPFPEHHHRPLPTGALRAVPQPSGGFAAPTGAVPFKDDVPVTNLIA